MEQNDGLAVEWYHKSAGHGNADAQNSLGNRYYNGQGVEQNYQLAKDCFYKSAEQGGTSAKEELEKLKA